MRLVFTTLQGSLIHPSAGTVALAQPALQALSRRSIPLIYVSVSTAAELLSQQLPLEHPFIAEDGGAIYVPQGYFPSTILDWPASEFPTWQVYHLGLPYDHLRQVLQDIRPSLHGGLIGFGDWTDGELAAALNVEISLAIAMRQRQTSELFSYSGDPELLQTLVSQHHLQLRQLERQPLKGKWLLTGNCNRALAIAMLIECYERYVGAVTCLGIGSNAVDCEWLTAMDRGVMLPDLATWSGEIATLAGPEGWREVVLDWLSHTDTTIN